VAVIGLEQPGQILFLTEGPRHKPELLRENVITVGDHVVVLHSEYGTALPQIQNFCSGLSASENIHRLVDAIDSYFGTIPVQPVGAIVSGFQPGGNPLMVGVAPGQERLVFDGWVVGGGLPPNVMFYLMRNLHSGLLSYGDGLEFMILVGLMYADLLKSFGYSDGFGIMRLVAGSAPEWVEGAEFDQSLARVLRRMTAVRGLLAEVLAK
jgi:hypothetical protein